MTTQNPALDGTIKVEVEYNDAGGTASDAKQAAGIGTSRAFERNLEKINDKLNAQNSILASVNKRQDRINNYLASFHDSLKNVNRELGKLASRVGNVNESLRGRRGGDAGRTTRDSTEAQVIRSQARADAIRSDSLRKAERLQRLQDEGKERREESHRRSEERRTTVHGESERRKEQVYNQRFLTAQNRLLVANVAAQKATGREEEMQLAKTPEGQATLMRKRLGRKLVEAQTTKEWEAENKEAMKAAGMPRSKDKAGGGIFGRQFLDMKNIWTKLLGVFTIGVAFKNSKVANSLLSTISQLLGAMMDLFIMPFMPLILPLMKFLASMVGWLQRFMQDPWAALKELPGHVWDLLKAFFTGDITTEQILNFIFGAIGLITGAKVLGWLFTAPVKGMQLATHVFGKGVLGTGRTAINALKSILGLGTTAAATASKTVLPVAASATRTVGSAVSNVAAGAARVGATRTMGTGAGAVRGMLGPLGRAVPMLGPLGMLVGTGLAVWEAYKMNKADLASAAVQKGIDLESGEMLDPKHRNISNYLNLKPGESITIGGPEQLAKQLYPWLPAAMKENVFGYRHAGEMGPDEAVGIAATRGMSQEYINTLFGKFGQGSNIQAMEGDPSGFAMYNRILTGLTSALQRDELTKTVNIVVGSGPGLFVTKVSENEYTVALEDSDQRGSWEFSPAG